MDEQELKRLQADEDWVRGRVNMALIYQQDEPVQGSREQLANWFRSPGYREAVLQGEKNGELALAARRTAEAKAKALGIEDWSPFYVEEIQRLENEQKKDPMD